MTFQGTWDLDAKWTWQSSRLVEPWCSYVWHAYWSCKSFHQLFFFTILLLIFYHKLWFFGKRWNVNCMLKCWMAWGIYVDFENWCPDYLLDCRPHCYRKHRTQPVVINVPCVTVFVVLNSAVIKWLNQSKCGLGGPKEPFWGEASPDDAAFKTCSTSHQQELWMDDSRLMLLYKWVFRSVCSCLTLRDYVENVVKMCM